VVRLQFGGFFELLEHHFVVAEFLLDFGVSDVTGGQVVFQLECLFEGHGSFFVVFGFIINQAEVVQAGRRGLDARGNFEAVDGVAVFLLFGIKDAEAVVGGGVFFIDF
jgi:hypothetical protein